MERQAYNNNNNNNNHFSLLLPYDAKNATELSPTIFSTFNNILRVAPGLNLVPVAPVPGTQERTRCQIHAVILHGWGLGKTTQPPPRPGGARTE